MKSSSAAWPDVPDGRRKIMAAIKGRDTKPELALRSMLHALGYRYRVHVGGVPGRPDLVFSRRKKAIFVHGCFWHSHEGCPAATKPKVRTGYWGPKLLRNRERDERALAQLAEAGWTTLVIWECEASDLDATRQRAATFLGPPKR